MDRLINTVRPYAWGSTTAIPALLGVPPTGEHQAEMWMGAHPGAPSRTASDDTPLPEAIAADPVGQLSAAVVDRYGPTLPFLLKILAAETPLSLQVHPTIAQARAGFDDEEARGIPLDAPERNYKDRNHKPEMIVALGDFEGLCGFRDPARTADLLDLLGVPELAGWTEILRGKPAPEALREVLTAALSADATALAPLVTATTQALRLASTTDSPWADTCRAYADAAAHYPADPGLFAAMLLNHVTLTAGEALYLGAGVPHAYLHGLGVEIMASSDNVLRCGFTPKHIDVPELLRVVDFTPGDPAVLQPVDGPEPGEKRYPAPIDDFRLSRYDAPATLPTGLPQILLCAAGEAVLQQADTPPLTLTPGQSAYTPATDPATTL
ncbi:mannose-6-phosphate isomerase, class I, partial [Mangrovactinospora gilvigrisea]